MPIPVSCIPTSLLPLLSQAHTQILDALLRVDALLTAVERRNLCTALNALREASMSLEGHKDSEEI